MELEEITKLDAKVRAVLADDLESRNSDITLTIAVWLRFESDKIVKNISTGRRYVALDDLFTLPREDNIKRVRAKIQNDEKKYVPTRLDVALKRKWLEGEWRKYVAKPDTLFPMDPE